MAAQVTGFRSTGAVDDNVELGVPGTVHLIDLDNNMGGAVHDKAHKDVILYPTPSADPEDPLNWSRKRKLMNSFCLQLYTFMVAGGTATGYAVYPQIIENTGIPLATLNSAVSVMFLFLGWGCLFWCPIALQYGRRGTYILSMTACMCMNLWAPYTTSAGTWYAHRIIYGFFGAPIEALVEQSMPDIFFTHERGFHVGMFLLWIGGASYLFPIAAGYVAQNMNWHRWCFYFPSIFMAVSIVFLFFFMDETMYDRKLLESQAIERARAAASGTAHAEATTAETDMTSKEAQTTEKPQQEGSDASVSSEAREAGLVPIYERPTYWKKMRLFRIIPGKENHLLAMMTRPIMHAWNFPIMAMSGIQYGSFLMWFTVLNATWTSILQADPYNFSPGITGVAYVAPFLGSLIGAFYSGWFGDKFHMWMARRNGGIREPEQRLWLYIACTITTMTGLLLWGVASADKVSWVAVLFGAGMMGFGGLLGEGMITMTLIRNTMGFAMGYAITPWFETDGIRNTFITISILSIVLTCAFFPFIYFGKAERKRTADRYRRYAATATMTHDE
ncbi:hypothetical protein A1O1_02774 [Capronia coronata CBS 617.96]|uniref:Major facilitator superfamily (MFS) profile domain-containing protein n=1 Tax=Capronia coronata CBS 617.96 TaxID=1182541 RepID=W9YXJ4_9EURO|nr:uncharacterized protein A1O1_02774 [Capronia coronata CBS 617.96]EXJ94380.1 hypothetical protein A1O1_02774 [Capronia coronata CBS 617.96]